MNEIVWAEPAGMSDKSVTGRAGKYSAFAEALRSKPGEWAIVPGERFASMVSTIKNGTLSDFRPAGAFEATARDVDQVTQRATVYVRYVGQEGA